MRIAASSVRAIRAVPNHHCRCMPRVAGGGNSYYWRRRRQVRAEGAFPACGAGPGLAGTAASLAKGGTALTSNHRKHSRGDSLQSIRIYDLAERSGCTLVCVAIVTNGRRTRQLTLREWSKGHDLPLNIGAMATSNDAHDENHPERITRTRPHQIHVWLSDREVQWLKSLAEGQDETLGETIRRLLRLHRTESLGR